MEPETRQPGSSGARHQWRRADGQLPVVGRIFPAPVAVKVPEIIFLFWVVKILTTAGGEVTSDYLKKYGNFGGGGTEVALFVIALVLQFATRRYRALLLLVAWRTRSRSPAPACRTSCTSTSTSPTPARH